MPLATSLPYVTAIHDMHTASFEILWLLTSSIHVELVTHTCPDVMTADIFIPYLLVLGAEEVDVAELAARRIQLLASVGIRGVANCQLDTD